MAKKQVVELGDQAKDIITKFKGVVTAYVKPLFGVPRFEITPEGKGSDIPDAYAIDFNNIVVVKKKVVSVVPPQSHPFENGQGVVDIITGLEGFVVAQVTYINGCAYVQVQPSIGDILAYPVKSLKATKKKLKLPEDEELTGGPVIRILKRY